ncbi:MAG: hypothetical protein IKB87_04920 [Clostridia bacterium]|nr:hypothetical protein [Clostridia bacterium]
MSLAEQIERDVRDIFLNTNDFARPRQWNGQTVTVIEDRDKLDDLKAKRDDLRQASKMLYISETDLSGMPVVGAGVTYEERRYRVMECSLEEGMYVILLGEVRR